MQPTAVSEIKKLVSEYHFDFGYGEEEQEHPGDDKDYYNCQLLDDIGPLKKGYRCDISIETTGDFTISVKGRNTNDYYAWFYFAPIWICQDESCIDDHKKSNLGYF